jgi:chromosome segregation ATPase
MPPVDTPKSDPLILLLDEIEILSAQTRLMELYLKRAHTAAFGEVEKIQEQFRAKVTDLKAKLEDKENSFSEHLSVFRSEQNQLNTQNQALLQRLAEQQNLIQHGQEESERRGAAIVALRERLSRLEAANQELESAAALRVEQAHQDVNSRLAQLQAELAEKEQALQQRQTDVSQLERSAQTKIHSLEEELAHSRESAERQIAEIQRAESDRLELRQALEQLESANEQLHAEAARELASARQDAQAKFAALQSEIAHKTALLTRNQTTIAGLEQEVKASAEALGAQEAAKQGLLESHAMEIARRDAELAAHCGRIAELEETAQNQQLAAVNELSQARENFAAKLAALRSELTEKQRLLEEGNGVLQNVVQELRNRNRELQGKVAAKESVVESQEDHLRQAQAELLVARDALAEKERALADWQARATEQEQSIQAQSNEWQCQLAEKQLLVESRGDEIERVKGDLAAERQRLSDALEGRSGLQGRAQQLAAAVESLTVQLNERQAQLESQNEILHQTQAQAAELRATLGAAREALDEQQTNARRAEREFETRFTELREELERREQLLRERDVAATRAEPAFKSQIEELQSRVQEKDRLLEVRTREVGVLQVRVESLSGQAERLEAAHKQALADAASETERVRQALQAEIAALQTASESQQALLEERHTADGEIERNQRAEIDALKEQLARQQTLAETRSAELRQAEAEANALREHVAGLESTRHRAAETPPERSEADANRIAALEQQLQSKEQALAERDAALRLMEQQLQSQTGEARLTLAQSGAHSQSEQLKAAEDTIADLLERLAQLEAARHMLQDNASHELQQLRDNFEARIAKLRMELTAKDQTPEGHRTVITSLEQGFQRQIQELRGQLAEKHSLLENRNEELIKVKAEMDALQDRLARLKAGRGQDVINAAFSVELREEDAIDVSRGGATGSEQRAALRPDPLQLLGAAAEAGMVNGAISNDTVGHDRTNRFARLEERVRSWNPELDKDSAMGVGRRWNVGLFKRRWKS